MKLDDAIKKADWAKNPKHKFAQPCEVTDSVIMFNRNVMGYLNQTWFSDDVYHKDRARITGALLAHCYNHFQEVVKALEDAERTLRHIAGDDLYNTEQWRNTLKKAKEVELYTPPDKAEDVTAKLLHELKAFVAHYPSGTNPELDKVYAAALDTIRRAEELEV